MTPRALELRDETLQVLFWMRGEGLGDEADATALGMWVAAERAELEPVLAWMLADGLLELGRRHGTFGLSPSGLDEGGRRFTETFADAGLGVQGHGECAPGCDCLEHGPEHCPAHHHHANAEAHGHGSTSDA